MTDDEAASSGGRPRLLDRVELDDDQRRLADRVLATRAARGQEAGYRAALGDGRLVGPFDAPLRVPSIGERQLDWAEAVSSGDLAPIDREVAVLSCFQVPAPDA